MASRMSKPWLIAVTLIIAVLALVGGSLSCSSPSPSDSTPQPHKAPDFTLPTMTGSEVTLSELEGTPVVLNFWATTCAFCAVELPYFEAVAQKSEGEIKVIAIDVGESASRVQTFFGDYEPTMIIALDRNGEAFVDYCQKYNNPRGYIPITLFVDSEGMVKYVKLGAFKSETELWDSLHSIF